MAGAQSIDLLLVSPAATVAEVPTDPWWLRIEQDHPDDRVTTGEIAELVDTLYDLNPCVDTAEAESEKQEDEENQPTAADLLAAAKAAYDANGAAGRSGRGDLAACQQKMSGDYTAQLKIVRSHQSEGYKLVFGVEQGEVKIVETVIIDDEIDTTIDISDQESVTLDYPIAAGFHASWQGQVIGDEDSVSPAPAIKRTGNTLFWGGGSLTGSLRAVYQTVYDLVTIEVPGKPKFDGATMGDNQDVNVLAFYHRLVFTGEVSPPPVDEGADQKTLGELCDWSDLDLPPEGDDEPTEPPADEAEYGCIAPAEGLANPAFYEAVCCHAASNLPSCAVHASPKPGKDLDQETKDAIIASHDGPVEFISVGPGPLGCGKIFRRQQVNPRNCCDEAPPIVVPDLDRVVGDNSQITLSVQGGKDGLWHWSVRHIGAYLDRNRTTQDAVTSGPSVTMYTTDVCGTIHVSVTDGCTVGDVAVRAETGQWVMIGDWRYVGDFGTAPPSCIGGAGEVLSNSTDYQTVLFINGGYKYQETVRKDQSVSEGGAPVPDHPCAEKCMQTVAAAATNAVPFCSTLQPPGPTCTPAYCCDCGNGMRYKYGGSTTWYGEAASLYSATKWRWEC